jgi:DNA-binding beta-propeller fold protein YncE
LYVADYSNNRIQKFDLSTNSSGITVAGGNGAGSAANQLTYPLDVHVSQLNGAIYVADNGNNRVQRWNVNATQGITVAGDPRGASGVSPTTLSGPFAITLDPINETFLYVSDYNSNRVLRFTLA